jgi:hypothetical protein
VSRLTRLTVFAVAGILFAAASSMSAQPDHVTGCYRFDRPLGSSATGALERNDSTWYMLRLLPNAKLSRPALASPWREQYVARSSWWMDGDTLRIRITTGLVGWDLALVARKSHWVGRAHYLSDAIGGPPFVVPVDAVAEPCRSTQLPRRHARI